MPTSRRGRRRRHRRGKRKRPTTKALARRVRKLELAPELKYFDTSNAQQYVDYDGIIHDLCEPPQGTTFQQRSGDEILVKSVTIRGHLNYTANWSNALVVLFWDDQDVITLPSQIMAYTGSVNQYLNPISPVAFPFRDDSRILAYKMLHVDSNRQMHSFRIHKRLNRKMIFAPSSVTQTANSLKMLVIGDSINTDVARPKITYVTRTLYTDD